MALSSSNFLLGGLLDAGADPGTILTNHRALLSHEALVLVEPSLDLVAFALALSEIQKYCGVEGPTVIT